MKLFLLSVSLTFSQRGSFCAWKTSFLSQNLSKKFFFKCCFLWLLVQNWVFWHTFGFPTKLFCAWKTLFSLSVSNKETFDWMLVQNWVYWRTFGFHGDYGWRFNVVDGFLNFDKESSFKIKNLDPLDEKRKIRLFWKPIKTKIELIVQWW